MATVVCRRFSLLDIFRVAFRRGPQHRADATVLQLRPELVLLVLVGLLYAVSFYLLGELHKGLLQLVALIGVDGGTYVADGCFRLEFLIGLFLLGLILPESGVKVVQLLGDRHPRQYVVPPR